MADWSWSCVVTGGTLVRKGEREGREKRTVAFGIPAAELGVVLIELILDGAAAVLEGLPEPVVVEAVAALRRPAVPPAVAAMMLLNAPLEVLDLGVLASVELALLALLDDAVVEVDACREGARDSGDECCDDKPLL